MKQRLKAVRKALKFTQVDFAKQLGITQTAYSMIENGYRPISQRYVRLLCATFRVSEKWLVDGEGEMFGASPYEKEFGRIFEKLCEEHQAFLLQTARGLLRAEEKIKAKHPKE